MINPDTFHFLKLLKKNNDREWFEKNRGKFELAKADFSLFINELIEQLGKINPALKGQQAKDVVFRIYRDVRFSKNKDPYKLNFGAYLCEGGKKSDKPGFYLQIQPDGKSFAGGGCWMPQGPQLKAVRQEIQFHTADFKKIIENKNFKANFKSLSDIKLKTIPKGFSKDDPHIEWYKYTSYIVEHHYTDKEVLAKDFLKQIAETYKAMYPLLTFLNRAIS